MTALCRRFPDDSSISTSFIAATALHVRNPETVKKTAKIFLAARKDDLLLWEALGWSHIHPKKLHSKVLFLMLHFSGLSLSTCGRRDESLQIFSQACMFGAKLSGAGKEVLPRVVLSAVLTGIIRIHCSFCCDVRLAYEVVQP